MKTFSYIVFAGVVLFFIGQYFDNKDQIVMQRYDGCYEVYTAHKIDATDFPLFMQNCMK